MIKKVSFCVIMRQHWGWLKNSCALWSKLTSSLTFLKVTRRVGRKTVAEKRSRYKPQSCGIVRSLLCFRSPTLVSPLHSILPMAGQWSSILSHWGTSSDASQSAKRGCDLLMKSFANTWWCQLCYWWNLELMKQKDLLPRIHFDIIVKIDGTASDTCRDKAAPISRSS